MPEDEPPELLPDEPAEEEPLEDEPEEPLDEELPPVLVIEPDPLVVDVVVEAGSVEVVAGEDELSSDVEPDLHAASTRGSVKQST